MFKFRRSKNNRRVEEDEPMVGKGSSSCSGNIPTPHQKLLAKQQQQQGRKILGRRPNSNPRANNRQSGPHSRFSRSDVSLHSETDGTSDAELEEPKALHRRSEPTKEDDDSDSYPSVGNNVVSSKPPPRKSKVRVSRHEDGIKQVSPTSSPPIAPPGRRPEKNDARRPRSTDPPNRPPNSPATVRSVQSDSRSAAENAAMQKLASLVVSLRNELETVKKEKEVEEKWRRSGMRDGLAIGGDSFSERLKRENDELKQDIDAFLLENDSLSKEIDELNMEKEAMNDLIERLKRENMHDVSANSLNTTSPASVLTHPMGSAKSLKLESRIRDLVEENHKLEGEIQLLVGEKQDMLQNHSAALENSAARIDEMEELKAGILEMKGRLTERESAAELDGKRYAETVVRLREEIADVTIVKEEIKTELRESIQTISELERELERKEEEGIEISRRREEEVTRVRDELKKCEEDGRALRESNEELSLMTNDMKNRFNELVMSRSSMQADLHRLRQENIKISEELKTVSSANTSPSHFSADTVLTLQKMISALERSKQQLEKDLQEKDALLKSEMANAEHLEHKLRVQEELSSSKVDDDSSLTERMSFIISTSEEMKSRIACLEGERNTAEDALKEVKTQIAAKDELIMMLEVTVANLQTEHSANIITISSLEERISSLQTSKAKLEDDCQEATEAIALLEEELESKDTALKEELVSIANLRQKLSQLEKENIIFTTGNEKLKTEIDGLNTRIELLITERNAANEDIEALTKASDKADAELIALVESNATEKEELTNTISRLQVELDESSDAIAVLKEELLRVEDLMSESDAAIKDLEASLGEKEMTLVNIESSKSQLQAEHQVSVDTISTLQKMIRSCEKSKDELEVELNASSEKIAELNDKLNQSSPISQVMDLENKLTDSQANNSALTERVSELAATNEELTQQVREMLMQISCSPQNTDLVMRSSSVGADPDMSSSCLIVGLKKQVQDLLSARDAALNEVEMLRCGPTPISNQNMTSEGIFLSESQDDDDMSQDTPLMETKPCDEESPSPSSRTIPGPSTPLPCTSSTSSSNNTSRGSSLLEKAKLLCHKIDEKRSKTPEKRVDEHDEKPLSRELTEDYAVKAAQNTTGRMKPDSNEEKASAIPEVSDPMAVKVYSDVKEDTKPLIPEKKIDIDHLSAIYLEKSGLSISKFSDISSDASSIRRRPIPSNSNVITKKVKICRNGVFMGTYEGDLNYEGQRHGFGVLICDNGNSYEGDWVKDKRDGLGVARYSSGDVYDGEWQKGKRQGHGVMYIEAGDTYIGGWNNGLKHGAGTYHWADGEVDVSWYQEDRRVGEGVRWNATRNKAYRLLRGARQEEISLEQAYKTAAKLGLKLTKVDSVTLD